MHIPPSPPHTPSRAKESITVAVEEVPTPTATPTSTPPPSVEAESFGSKPLEDVSTPHVSHCMHACFIREMWFYDCSCVVDPLYYV